LRKEGKAYKKGEERGGKGGTDLAALKAKTIIPSDFPSEERKEKRGRELLVKRGKKGKTS